MGLRKVENSLLENILSETEREKKIMEKREHKRNVAYDKKMNTHVIEVIEEESGRMEQK